jgi:hypothetical protein
MNAALRRQHLVRHLHRLGERAVDELLVELAAAHDLEADIIARLETYGRLDPQLLVALGADRIAPRPLLLVGDAA